jgi:hypothetical protein
MTFAQAANANNPHGGVQWGSLARDHYARTEIGPIPTPAPLRGVTPKLNLNLKY